MLNRLISKFAVAQTLNLLAPLISSIALGSVASADEWVTVALGLTLGGGFALLVSGGWSLQGAGELLTNPNSHSITLRISTLYRLLNFSVVFVVISVIGVVLFDALSAVSFIFSASALAITAAGPRWYYSSTGRVQQLILRDVLPRLGGTVIAILVVLLTKNVALYTIIFFLAQALPAALVINREFLSVVKSFAPSSYLRNWKEMWFSAATEIVGYLYVASPVFLAAVFASTSFASEIASAARIFSLALTFIIVLSNASQSALIINDANRTKVLALGIKLHFALGVSGMLAFWALSAPLSELLFPNHPISDTAIGFSFGIAFFAIAFATPFVRNVLLLNKMAREVLISNILGLASGIVMLALGLCLGNYTWITLLPYVSAEVVVMFVSLYFSYFRKKMVS